VRRWMIAFWCVICLSAPWSTIHGITGSSEVALIINKPIFWGSVELLAKFIVPAVANVVDAPIQPRTKFNDVLGWREKTVVPQEFSMFEAVQRAKLLPPPVQGGTLSNTLQVVIKLIAGMGEQIVPWRNVQQQRVKSIAVRLNTLNADLRALVPAHGRNINGNMHFAMLYALHAVIGYADRYVIDKMLFGFEVVYNIPTSSVFRAVSEPPVMPFTTLENVECFDMVSRRLHKAAREAMRAEADPQAAQTMQVVWEGIVGNNGEVQRGLMDGGPDGRGYSRQQIWSMFSHVQGGPRCLLRFGVWQNDKCRGCDNGALCGHNDRTQLEETIVCIAADFPSQVAREFAKYNREWRIRIGTDDVDSAYRRVLCAQPWYTVVAAWDTGRKEVRYFTMPGHPFGLRSAVINFNRVERFLVEVQRIVFLVACGGYFDDEVICEPEFTGSTGQQIIWWLHQLVGFPFAEKKHEKMRFKNTFLGVVNDAAAVAGCILIKIKEKRRAKMIRQLQDILSRGSLSAAEAASIRGKLTFISMWAFGAVGKAPLQALARRQYSKRGSEDLDENLVQAIQFLLKLLPTLPAIRIPLWDDKPEETLLIWSDAMFEPLQDEQGEYITVRDETTGREFRAAKATLAFSVFVPWLSGGKWFHSYKDVGMDVFAQMVPGKKTYIGQLELLAAAATIYSLPDEILRGRRAYFWIDNMGAKYGLQKSGSSKEDSARIINAFAVRAVSLLFRPWFEWIPSEQNIADLPSRGRMEEYFQVIGASKDGLNEKGEEVSTFLPMVLPDFSSWSAPLTNVLTNKKRRRGDRGAGRSGD